MSQLNLFNETEGFRFPEELLEYFPGFMETTAALTLMHTLIDTVPWEQHLQRMYDKEVLTPRLTAWYGDPDKTYHMAGKTLQMHAWLPELQALREQITTTTGHTFNSVLLNFYRDENDSVAWHRDKESELGNRPVIASVSLGAARPFEFRQLDNHSNKYALTLGNGSLLLMKGDLQQQWEHRIAKAGYKLKPRINLTFRSIRI
ncbi:alpha-ketoglutarate-dependent dioxygenase AlkB [Chitinophaga sp. sic0106]|uniref:alpha-ketoglutarate-dependent dioxygenase AlkB family protein n=1 Tax=Chitinophaga sp. sic0106 TaxID=2854785 RepID=UPI001C4644E5|nr:alpha-ketoglutarate-dependent dioxygenase AlkB [Chitinophaga sp. sic0106]MBV7529588.1 alpha-ketoglutarate-dependent dioxygenase AlkB [Chitinophaga sp. sic0106]